MRHALTLALLLSAMNATAYAQVATSGPTQTRDGLGTAGHPASPANSSPAGSENAATGAQSHPAYPSGSTTANPGAAFVRDQPKPATGSLASPPGKVTTPTTPIPRS